MTPALIRPAEARDEEAFVRLNLAFMDEVMAAHPYWTALERPAPEAMGAVFRQALVQPEAIGIFVAELDGRVVAYTNTWTVFSIWSGGRSLIVDDLYVEAGFRHLGLGRAIMAHLEEHARREGYRRLQLQAEPDNTKARRLYRELGFQEEPMQFFMKPC